MGLHGHRDAGDQPSLLFLLTHEVKSGDGQVISKRLQFVRVLPDGSAAFASLLLNPPQPFAAIVNGIADRESQDVAHNIAVLDGIASRPVAHPAVAPVSG